MEQLREYQLKREYPICQFCRHQIKDKPFKVTIYKDIHLNYHYDCYQCHQYKMALSHS